MSSKKTYFRVCHRETLQGLWYAFNGEFTGLIHTDFNFCQNNGLRMEFDEEIVGWLSAVETLDSLFHWFSIEDITKLEEHGWFIHEFEAEDVKFYERFQHTVIKQDTSKVIQVHKLNVLQSNSDEDMIEFAKWFRTEDTQENAEMYFGYTDLDMLNHWKSKQPKYLYIK